MADVAKPSPIIIPDDPARAALRWSVYWLLIAISVGAMVGRILAVNSVDVLGLQKYLRDSVKRDDWKKERPFLSGNDRSRWLTVRALVERGSYTIEEYVADPKTHPNWDTIDMVMHRDTAGTPHLYSSKPPLLATLYAAPYWLVVNTTGYTLETHPHEIGRPILLLVNVLQLVIYFLVIAKLVERFGRTDWGRIFIVAAATLGTFLTTFAVVVNNHLPAAVSAAIALYAAVRIWYDGERHWKYFALAGFFAAFTFACELPALSFFGLLGAALLWKAPRKTLLFGVPAALVVLAAYFGTNYLAHGTLIPAYAHRDTERKAEAAVAKPQAATAAATTEIAPGYYEGTVTLDSGAVLTLRGNEQNWYDYQYTRTDRKAPVESYWRNPKGVDAGEPNAAKYALHALIGHHGIFSLTPVWLLAIPGVVMLGKGEQYRLRELALFIALLSIICLAFYLSRPPIDRNYGGTASALRWMFWFAPMWLVAALPAADRLTCCRGGRAFGGILLALSVLSASYPTWNPWSHPWLMNFWTYQGW